VRHLYCNFSDQKGWSVFTNEIIPRGGDIVAYAGEVLKSAEAARRHKEVYDPLRINYVLTIKEVHDNFVLVTNVDATSYGNVSRLVNHSCEPNAEVYMHRPSKESVLALPTLRALRVIGCGEEVLYNDSRYHDYR
jgi:SET domain-containing protein